NESGESAAGRSPLPPSTVTSGSSRFQALDPGSSSLTSARFGAGPEASSAEAMSRIVRNSQTELAITAITVTMPISATAHKGRRILGGVRRFLDLLLIETLSCSSECGAL